MFHSCWTGCTAHPLLQNTACISKFKQRFTALLNCTAKPETQEGTMQSAEQQKCHLHTGLHRNQHSQQRPGSGNFRQPDQGDLKWQKVCCHRSTLPSPVLQLQTPEPLSHHCFGHAATYIVPVLGRFNSIVNLLKAPIVYLNKAATGFCTVIAKPRFLVTHYTLISLWEKIHTHATL